MNREVQEITKELGRIADGIEGLTETIRGLEEIRIVEDIRGEEEVSCGLYQCESTGCGGCGDDTGYLEEQEDIEEEFSFEEYKEDFGYDEDTGYFGDGQDIGGASLEYDIFGGYGEYEDESEGYDLYEDEEEEDEEDIFSHEEYIPGEDVLTETDITDFIDSVTKAILTGITANYDSERVGRS